MHLVRKKIIIVILCLGEASAWAWFSTSYGPGNDTHGPSTEDAIQSVSAECPDLGTYLFSNEVRDGSKSIDNDTRAHGGTIAPNDGPVQLWWNRAQREYLRFHFKGEATDDVTINDNGGAYYYIGQLIHVIEDMAVPAHAFDISHASAYDFDNFEEYGAQNIPRARPQPIPGSDPVIYRNEIRNHVQDIVINNIEIASPPGRSWTDYWRPNIYGGLNGEDIFPTKNEELFSTQETALNSHLQLDARKFSSGALLAASKSLPPLVRDLALSITTLNGSDPFRVTFILLDNRTPNIIYSAKILDSNFNEVITLISPTLFTLGPVFSNNDLPFRGKIADITWDGKVNGEFQTNGLYYVEIKLIDEDGNDTPESVNNDDISSNDTRVPFIISLCNSNEPDVISPEITLSNPTKCLNTAGGVEICGKVSDSCSDPTLTVNNQPIGLTPNNHSADFCTTVSVQEGSNTFNFEATDAGKQYRFS